MTGRRHGGLAAVLAIYLVLGAVYGIVTPVFEAPDEPQHFFVIKHIAEHRALPVQSGPGEEASPGEGLWEQEASQPPLYYVIGALLVGSIDMADAEMLLWSNPQANIGDPANPGNKNAYVHPPTQDFPWRGSVLAVHVLRFYSLALGAATIVLAWATVRMLFPRSGLLAEVVAGLIALIPQFLFISSSVNNDNVMVCLGTLCLYLSMRRLREIGSGSPQLGRWVTLGLVLGLALLAKLSALTLLALIAFVVLLVAWHRRSWRRALVVALATAIPAALVAGWWYARNVILYGEPTGLTAMWDVVGLRDDFGQDLWGEFRALRYSFWGLFGWFSVPMSLWVYQALDVLSVVALAGVAIAVGRWVRQGSWEAVWHAWRHRVRGWGAAYPPICLGLMATWQGITLLSLTRWTSLTYGTQGRLLYVGIVPVVLFLVLGLRAWLPKRGPTRGIAGVVLVAGLFGLAAATPFAWLGPAYARPRPISVLPEEAISLNLAFGNTIRLRGVGFEQQVVRPGETLKVNLYWEALRAIPRDDDVMVWLRLLDAHGEGVGLEDSYPGSGTMPASLWPVGRLLAARQYVRVGADTDAPMVARLDVSLYREDGGGRLEVPGQDVPTIGRVKIVPRRWPQVRRGQFIAGFACGDIVSEGGTLGPKEGVTLAAGAWEEAIQPGATTTVTLTWVVQTPPGRDYRVFVHLVDDGGTIHASGDGAPCGGDYPTWAWEAKEVIVDEHTFAVAEDVAAGRYQIRVGLYDAGGRVAVYDADGARLPEDAVLLGSVAIR